MILAWRLVEADSARQIVSLTRLFDMAQDGGSPGLTSVCMKYRVLVFVHTSSKVLLNCYAK